MATEIIDPRAITPEEAAKHDRGSLCPKCGADGDYAASEFGDESVWQDADCANGHAWREISTLTSIVALDEKYGGEVGAPVEYPRLDVVELVDAARSVVASWESGDLAGAVNRLEAALVDYADVKV